MRYKIGDLVVTNAGTKAKIIGIVGDNHYEIKSNNGELVAHGHCLSPLSIKKSTKVDDFEEITKEMLELYKKKNHDYGDSFGETYRDLGIISAVTRIVDKVNRLKSLTTKEQKVNDESIRDTLIDMCAYGIMTIIELEREDEQEKAVKECKKEY